MGKKLITGGVRALFPHLFKPHAMDDNETKKYSVIALIDKSDLKTVDSIKAAIDSEIWKRWGGRAGNLNIQSPLHDGDGFKPNSNTPYGSDFHGCYFLTAKSTEAPGVVDANLNPITDQKAISNNDVLRLSIELYPYDRSGRRGVYVELLNVQQVSKGGGPKPKPTAAEDFGAVEIESETETEDFLQ